MDRRTQWQKKLDYCNANGSITCRDAFGLGINSPTKRISEMKRNPEYTVDSQMEYRLDADGKTETRYKRYWISEVEP